MRTDVQERLVTRSTCQRWSGAVDGDAQILQGRLAAGAARVRGLYRETGRTARSRRRARDAPRRIHA